MKMPKTKKKRAFHGNRWTKLKKASDDTQGGGAPLSCFQCHQELTSQNGVSEADSPSLWPNGVKGVLLDVTGVLYNSGPNGGTPIPGAKEALARLRDSNIPFKLCSNESCSTRKDFATKLNKHGLNVSEDEITCPAPILADMMRRDGLTPHLLVHPDVKPEFTVDSEAEPNCVVMGDCQEYFTYEALNEAFRVLLSLKEKRLYAMGAGYYYSEGGKLVLDVGSYATMLEAACGCKKTVCGKPEGFFFQHALDQLGISASECAMIGDDIVHDVGGAQKVGMVGVQVRTGKYRRDFDEPHPTVRPDAYVDDIADAVDQLLKSRSK